MTIILLKFCEWVFQVKKQKRVDALAFRITIWLIWPWRWQSSLVTFCSSPISRGRSRLVNIRKRWVSLFRPIRHSLHLKSCRWSRNDAITPMACSQTSLLLAIKPKLIQNYLSDWADLEICTRYRYSRYVCNMFIAYFNIFVQFSSKV